MFSQVFITICLVRNHKKEAALLPIMVIGPDLSGIRKLTRFLDIRFKPGLKVVIPLRRCYVSDALIAVTVTKLGKVPGCIGNQNTQEYQG